ncbi:peptide N-acetyl-beta-D-glucosaminyl asparaginase amidase A-domain-containing protein [Schizophyllum amplum]|uniref:Peptide N-acetyl-beta-D-glucosaminyl asparaginase amidase A-domain-containing protein n=1 Tax=Schizophyllum amplum TaxID=97359 RepID=A0A550C1J6_9AGAR|nr:peptide N-acetyl-beta-D-glucosaminyl asparaginase amidase A-domain-containing protein [Auriculariopsis ampla]
MRSLCALLGLVSVAIADVLVDFQVSQPPPLPVGVQECTVQVLQRDFANSYGDAEVVRLEPPTECGEPGSWSAISLNMTVTSNGTQYDRLGVFTFQNVEIWRTSTPEPTRGDGIIWSYIKDVTQYMPLFTRSGSFILQLDNLIQDNLDGVYATTVTATYYAATDAYPTAPQASTIIPLSTMANDTGNDASVPPGFSINVTIPVNTVKIFAELFASGNGQEEFWYGNVPNAYLDTLPDGITYGQGPFREVRLLIDGRVAGVAFPFPVIFTGGFSPASWRPIAAINALDLPRYAIDVTPFVPLLADGAPHNFTLDVASAEDDHTILDNWYVSGLLQVVTGASEAPTTGNMTVYEVGEYADSEAAGAVQDATRAVHIESVVVSGDGKETQVVWVQNLAYENRQTFSGDYLVQTITQSTSGTVSSTHNGETVVSDQFAYPLDINFTYGSADFDNWTFIIDHSYNRAGALSPFELSTNIESQQSSESIYQTASTGNYGNGTTNNTFIYSDAAGNTYTRSVNAAYNQITLDEEGGSLAGVEDDVMVAGSRDEAQKALTSAFANAKLRGGTGKRP